MSNLTATDNPITHKHGNITELLEKQWNSDTRRRYTKKLECKAEARIPVMEYLKGQIIQERDNGDFILITDVIENERMWFALLMSFGGAVKVLEPRKIIDMLKGKSGEIQKLYLD